MGNQYVMFGGIKKGKDGTVAPCNEIFVLRPAKTQCNWQRLEVSGPEPHPRSQHVAVAIDADRLFVFGGHYTPSVRLNDVWILNVRTGEWSHPDWYDPSVEPNNQPCPGGGPAPRANSAGVLYENKTKIYVFGGHGGVNFSRVSFNDLFCFDTETMAWEQCESTTKPPEVRGGHSMFWVGTKVYIFGGWNNEYQFESIWHYDVESKEWYEPEIGGTDILPRWNHSSVLVEAIPSWKYFIFGGESETFMEGGPRAFGKYQNSARYLDIETMSWTTIVTEDTDSPGGPQLPMPREYSAMAYDSKDSRLIIFGGWSNEWMNDIYTLNVSQIVGPPYAIAAIIPNLGQLSGNTEVRITGIGFRDTSSINIRFTCGKQYVEISGEYVSDTEIKALTKSFEEIGPKEAEVRLQIQGMDFTTQAVTFQYFMNTRAHKSLAYGPGLLKGAAVGQPVSFVVQARNDHDENRTSGNDKWNITIKAKNADGGSKTVEHTVDDLDNGSYLVTYQVDEPCSTSVDIQLFNDGIEIPLRGSPYTAEFEEVTTKNWNQLNGPFMQEFVKKQLEE